MIEQRNVKNSPRSLEDNLTIELPYTWLLLEDASLLRDLLGSIRSYGSFPCDWNGGRPFTIDAQEIYVGEGINDTLLNRGGSLDNIESVGRQLVPEIVKSLNDIGIPFYVTLSNIRPKKDGAIDEELFKFLESLASWREDNGVIVAHPRIYAAVKSRFGKRLKYIASVTRFNLLPEDLKDYNMLDDERLYQDFDRIVLRPEHVIQSLEPKSRIQGKDPLKGMDQKRKNKSIIIVNHSCRPHCPYQRRHYLDMIDVNHGAAQEYKDKCKRGRDLLITREARDKLMESGFSNFKIGRTMFYLLDTLDLFPALAPVIPWQKAQLPKSEIQSSIVIP